MPAPLSFFDAKLLRRTWRQLRKELRQATIRDVRDWLDWAVTLDQTLSELQKDLLDTSYVPTTPSRFEAAKSYGSYRVITVPNIRDALVYRHIADSVLERATPKKIKGAFFSRSHAATPVGKTFTITEDPSLTALDIWLRYNEYRSLTLMNQPYRVLVVSDITNYFDSIPHDLLLEHVAALGLPREAVGVLGKLIEVLRPTAGHSSSPRVGLAVDEFDCSRQLAHVFLFEHDHRVVQEFREDNYVRWMDDQNVGVDSIAQGRKVVNCLTRSLASQRLTLNSGKTRFLTPEEVAVHFQLEANKRLTEWQDRFKKSGRKPSPAMIDDFRQTCKGILTHPDTGKGNWDKVLKRAYGLAAQLGVDDLEADALGHLVAYPPLAERIFLYFARRNRGDQLLQLFSQYCNGGDNLHELTETLLFEALLLLDPTTTLSRRLKAVATAFAAGTHPNQTGRPLGRAAAIIAMYWFGASSNELLTLFDFTSARGLPKEVARAWLACGAARAPRLLTPLLHALVGNAGDDVARMARFLSMLVGGKLSTIGPYYHQRSRWPARGKYYDVRAWLALELCSHSSNNVLRARTRQDVVRFRKLTTTSPERAALKRVEARLK